MADRLVVPLEEIQVPKAERGVFRLRHLMDTFY